MNMPIGEGQYSSKRAAGLAGITYRQLDHWSRTEVIRSQCGGSGSRRTWSMDEVVLMATIGAITRFAGSGELDSIRADPSALAEAVGSGADVVAKVAGSWRALAGEDVASTLAASRAPVVSVVNLRMVRESIDGRRRAAAEASLASV